MTGVRRTILIVDDDRDFSESVAAFLEANGYHVEQAYDGRAGLTKARRTRPDLILMDVIMTERTEGFFTVQQLRRDEALARVPVFVVSSLYADVPGFRIDPDQKWLGHDEFFPKPLDMDRLLTAIEKHLGVATAAAGAQAEDATGSEPGSNGGGS